MPQCVKDLLIGQSDVVIALGVYAWFATLIMTTVGAVVALSNLTDRSDE
jgi:hypothetical protein